jgi:hypothetical protein
MTTPTDIDRTAPVIARHEIDINAPPDTVWRLQARESRAGRTVPRDITAWRAAHLPSATTADAESLPRKERSR